MSDLVPEAARAFMARPRPMLIDGQWVSATGGEVSEVINPADGSVIARAASGSGADANAAVVAARKSFEDKRWRGLTPAERERVLYTVAELIMTHADELATLETLDGGKLYGGARHGEIPAAAQTFRYYAGWCTKHEGHTFNPSVPGMRFHAYTRPEPVGVVAQIIPWNGPLVMAAWKLAPALAAGCSIVLKPAEQTPLTALRLGELLMGAGVPDGVVNIVTGPGRTVGSTLAAHPDVDKIAFTGSTAVGRQLLEAAKGNMKRLSLELGGKSPVIIMGDADLDLAIPGAADAIFGGAGQVCVAGSRIYAHRSVVDQVIAGVEEIAHTMRVGPGLDPDSRMGPLISGGHRNNVHGMVDRAQQDGAEIVCGGAALDGPGYFYAPTVLTGTRADMEIVREEVFGPVVTIAPFDDPQEAIAEANNSIYGLASSIWTRDLSTAHRMAEDIQAGIVWINTHGIPDMALPIGGMKQSGWGREHGLEGLQIYTETKAVMARI